MPSLDSLSLQCVAGVSRNGGCPLGLDRLPNVYDSPCGDKTRAMSVWCMLQLRYPVDDDDDDVDVVAAAIPRPAPPPAPPGLLSGGRRRAGGWLMAAGS